MASYIKATDFSAKDNLLTGDPLKIVSGTEIDNEFNAIQTAVNTKANTNSPGLTGTPTAPTATAGTSTVQIATTAFATTAVNTAVTNLTNTLTSNVTTVSVTLDNWVITQSGTTLIFSTGGVNKMKLDTSGNLTVTGDITAFGTV